MKKIAFFILTAVSAISFAACGGYGDKPATNNANANANTARRVAAPPTADALMALDKQANEAYIKGDSRFFEGFLSDKFVMRDGGQRMDKAAAVKMIAGVKCDVKTWNLDEQWMAKIDADTYVLSYKGTFDGTCAIDGKSMKMPSPIRAATVMVRSGDKWQAAFHGENLIIDPKNPPAPSTKPEAKKEEPKKDATMAAISAKSAAAAKTTGDANTDALVKAELAVWEAWKEHDAKKIEDATAGNLSFIDIFGNSYGNRADTIKAWSGSICDVKSVSVTDGAAYALSPTVELLTHTGAADGTCYGQKIGSVYGNSVYIKEGDAWKLAFTMNMPAK